MTPGVTSLWLYPLKGARGISVDTLTFDARGAIGDRRWMLVDDAGVCITQRGVPRLTLLQQSFVTADRDGALRLAMVGFGAIDVVVPPSGEARQVCVWDDTLPAHDAGDVAAAWCAVTLGVSCRLVRMAAFARRPLQSRFAGSLVAEGRETTLSDGAPLLLLGEQSVAHLNARLVAEGAEQITFARFRPNVVVATALPHDEDAWRDIVMGTMRISLGAPCKRCVVTTVDLQTAVRGVEPLRTLATYRRDDGHVMFGMNATHALEGMERGVVRVGDAVVVQSRR